MADNKLIELEYRGNIAILCFNRPSVHNSLNGKLMEKWKIHLDEIETLPNMQKHNYYRRRIKNILFRRRSELFCFIKDGKSLS